jgi:hypothetical protein
VVSGTVLEPGGRFDRSDDAGAIVLQSGERVEASPGRYFDSSSNGRTIRLWERTIPGVDRNSRRLAWWWARRDVAEVLSKADLEARLEEEAAGIRRKPIIAPIPAGARPRSTGRARVWQILIAAVLVAVVGGASLIMLGAVRPALDHALTNEELTALVGVGGLLIFGLTCMAIIQAATASQRGV